MVLFVNLIHFGFYFFFENAFISLFVTSVFYEFCIFPLLIGPLGLIFYSFRFLSKAAPTSVSFQAALPDWLGSNFVGVSSWGQFLGRFVLP